MSSCARWVALLSVLCVLNFGRCLDCYDCSSSNFKLLKGNECANGAQLKHVTCPENAVCLKGVYDANTANAPSGAIRMTMLRCVPDLASSDMECEIIFKSMEAMAVQLGGNAKQIECSTCKSDLCNKLSVSGSVVYLPSFLMVLGTVYGLICF